MKEVKKDTQRSKNFYFLTIYDSIKVGKNLKQICEDLQCSKQKLNYYLLPLKCANLIQKVGYGTWEIKAPFNENFNQNFKRCKKKILGHTPDTQELSALRPNDIRSHALVFNLKIPKIPDWNKRKEYLNRINMPYKEITLIGGGEQIEYKGRKIQFTNKSIIVYEKSSYFAETTVGSKNYTIYDFKQLIISLENLLHTSLKINGNYIFKICKFHYSLVRNSLAKQYDRENKKLRVYCGPGQYIIIDNSFNLHELEIEGKDIDRGDKASERMQESIKAIESGITIPALANSLKEIVDMVGKSQEIFNKEIPMRAEYNENLKSHIQAIKDLGNGIREFNNNIGRFNDNSAQQSVLLQKLMELIDKK